MADSPLRCPGCQVCGRLAVIPASGTLQGMTRARSGQALAWPLAADRRGSQRLRRSVAGASLRELIDRMGHSSTRAALVYLHGSDARQRAIADGLSKLVEREVRGSDQGRRKRPRWQDRARGGHAGRGRSRGRKE